MKRFPLLLTLVTLLICACTDYQTQIDALQQQLNEIASSNTDISADVSSLEDIVSALKNESEAVSFTPIATGGSVVGYTVKFKDGAALNLFNQPCNVTIVKDGGDYYWKADGEWLTSADGSKIKVAPDSRVPKFIIEDGVLKVSFDDGATYSEIGEAGSKYVESVAEGENAVTITLDGGQTIKIPKLKEAAVMRVVADLEDLPVRAGASVTVKYTVENASESSVLYAIANGGWKATVDAASPSEGRMTFTAPENGSESDVTLLLSDGDGTTFFQRVTFDVLPQVAPYDICAYHVPYGDLLTQFNFRKMAEAGVNISHSHNKNEFSRAAEASAGTGVWIIGDLQDYIYHYTTLSDEEYRTLINGSQQLVDDIEFYRKAENLWGYSIIDEPRDSLFVKIGILNDRIRQLDPVHKTYVNLWGDQMCDDSLIPYVNDSHPDFISFDQYPCTYNDVNSWWWERLENVHRISSQYNIPWWGFAASTDVENRNFGNGGCVPTEASIKLQMYGNILYGASALEYFTWVLYPGGVPGTPDQHYAPLSTTGEHTETYDMVYNVDREINARKFIFDGADIKWILHTRNSVPSGCRRIAMSEDPVMPDCIDWYQFSSQSHCLVELLENHGHEYLAIFNKEHTFTARVTFELTKDLMAVDSEGCFVPLELDENGTIVIGKGEVLILLVK